MPIGLFLHTRVTVFTTSITHTQRFMSSLALVSSVNRKVPVLVKQECLELVAMCNKKTLARYEQNEELQR